MNGYVQNTPKSEQLKNELSTVRGFVAEYPANEYWQNRLAALEAQHSTAEIDEWLTNEISQEAQDYFNEPCAISGGEVLTRGEMLWIEHPTGDDDIPF